MGIHVLDTSRAVDVLHEYGIEDVGVIGHSLGGTVVPYTMACDTRIKAGASSCGVATFDSVRRNCRVQNLAWPVHGIGTRFGEFHMLFDLISPRPVFVSAATDDHCLPIEGARQAVELGRYFYRNPGLLELYEFDGNHSFPTEARKRAYRVLDEHL